MFPDGIETFTRRAEAVSTAVIRCASMDDALDYAADVCRKKEACQLLISGCEADLSGPADEMCEQKQQKIIAAAGLESGEVDGLARRGVDMGFAVVSGGLRDRLAGVDVGLTRAEYGLADTGGVVVDSSAEDVRLATMISEIHMVLLPASRIAPDVRAIEAELTGRLADPPSFWAFITGASRTADIERVLTLGVHGPLECHVLILEND
jgi:L-lactate dehydrogenase complex protein LldG